MKKTAFMLVFGLFVAVALAPAQVPPPPPSEYAALLAKAKAGDPSVDYKKLRFAYLASPEFQPASTSEEGELFTALNAKQYETALKKADAILARDFVNFDAHYVAFMSQRALGNEQRASFHQAIFRGMLKSITDSGDGKRPQSAYQVMAIREEYVMLHILKLKPGKQHVEHSPDGHTFDVLEAKDAQDQTVTLYFNIDRWWEHLNNSVKPKS